jgi:hypothetical protein
MKSRLEMTSVALPMRAAIGHWLELVIGSIDDAWQIHRVIHLTHG